MEDIIHIGQWQGFFKYGRSYGGFLDGKEAEFRMFIETYDKGRFTGRIIDWEGFGAEGEVATLSGSIDGNAIRFTKQYNQLLLLDELGNLSADPRHPGYTVHYEGTYDLKTKCFYGRWKISIYYEDSGETLVDQRGAGTWRMLCQDQEKPGQP